MTRIHLLVLLGVLPACGSGVQQNGDGSLRIVKQIDAHWQSDVARSEMERALADHAEIAAVFAHDDDMALAAATVCRQKGRTDIKVVGVGGLPAQGLAYVTDGRLDATIQRNTGAAVTIDFALLACSGITLHRQIGLGPRVFTKATVAAGGTAQVAPGDFYVAMLRNEHAKVLDTNPEVDNVFRIGMAAPAEHDAWGEQVRQELTAAAKRYPQVQMDFRSPGDDREPQRAAMRWFLDQNYNVILVWAAASGDLAGLCKEAMERNVKVLVVGGEPSGDFGEQCYLCSIGVDEAAIGRAAAETIRGLVQKGGALVEIQGSMTSGIAQQRHRGFAEALGHRQ
ncbi:MAG TPA: substrate-binding domain-containing protein [Planctomycetota bacterium]|nr:substrate-binding domain-containing protein [Planctomycetota bacterium]